MFGKVEMRVVKEKSLGSGGVSGGREAIGRSHILRKKKKGVEREGENVRERRRGIWDYSGGFCAMKEERKVGGGGTMECANFSQFCFSWIQMSGGSVSSRPLHPHPPLISISIQIKCIKTISIHGPFQIHRIQLRGLLLSSFPHQFIKLFFSLPVILFDTRVFAFKA